MDFVTNFPLFTIIISLFSGALSMKLSGKAARRWTIAWECVLIGMAAAVLARTASTGESFTYVMGEFPAPWGNEIRAGVLEALLALFFLGVILCSVIAGGRYLLIDIDESKQNLYYSLLNLLTAAVMALCWTNDIFTGYVFLEILTLTSCGLTIVREIGRTTLAAVRYMIMNLLGSGLFLLGVILLYDVTGHLLMVPMQREIAVLAADPENLVTLGMAVGILTIGLAIKSGLFPFHYWMPDTYGWSTPVSGAVLSSVVSKCYIFLLIKIYMRSVGIDVIGRMPIRNILLTLGMGGIIFGSLSAVRADSINRMIAFSSAAQIGYIYMGIGLGGEAGFTAALFHMCAHAVTKSMLFLSTPRLAEVSGDSLLFGKLQGSAYRDKNAGVFFTVGALSMIGIPVFAGFSSKLLFASAAVNSGSSKKLILVMAVLAVSSLLNAIYFVRTLIRIYGVTEGELREGEFRKPVGGRLFYNVPMMVLTAANLALGLCSWAFAGLIAGGLSMFS